MAFHGPLGRQLAASCARFLPGPIRRSLRGGQAASGAIPAARNALAPVPAGGEMLLFRCAWDDGGGGRPADVYGAFAPGVVLFAYYNAAPWSSIVVVDNGQDNARPLGRRGTT